jgi:hypothetical protein
LYACSVTMSLGRSNASCPSNLSMKRIPKHKDKQHELKDD